VRSEERIGKCKKGKHTPSERVVRGSPDFVLREAGKYSILVKSEVKDF
jgi:hypothetical protein